MVGKVLKPSEAQLSVGHPGARRRQLAPGLVVGVGLVGATLTGGLAAYHWLVYVAHPGIPHTWTILDRLFEIGLASLLLLDGSLVGQRLLRLLRARWLLTPLEMAALSAGLGLGILSLGMLALGGLHLYYAATFAVLLLSIPILLQRDVRALAHYAASLATRHGGARFQLYGAGDALPRMVLAAVASCLLAFTILLDMTPPSSWTGYDTYQYHWAVPLLLLREHGWQAFPGWAHANLPFNSEMLNLITLSLQAPEAATLVQDGFTVLSALLIFAFVRRYFDDMAAWLAVIALATVPMLVMYGSQSYVEPALLFYGIASFALLARWVENLVAPGALNLNLVALAGVCFGLALGVKYMALEYLPGALLIIAIGIVCALRAQPTRDRWRWGASAAVNTLVMFATCSAIALFPWLLKDWLLLGNPVYPALAWLFGAPVWDDARTQMLQATFLHFGPHSGIVTQLHLYALDLFVHPKLYGEGLAFPMGIAAATALLALPYLIWALRRDRHGKRHVERHTALVVLVWGGATVLAFAAWSVSGALVERYALPPVVLASVLGVALLSWLAGRIPRRFKAVSLALPLIVACVLVCQNLDLYYANYVARSPFPLLRARMSEQTFMRAHLSLGISSDFWQATDYINEVLPDNGKLLMLGRGTGYFFTNRDYVADTGGDWVPYIVSEGKTSTGMTGVLRSQGITYVVYDGELMHWLTTGYDNKVLAGYLPGYLRFQSQDLVLIRRWGSVSLYEVPPQGGAPAASAPPASERRTRSA